MNSFQHGGTVKILYGSNFLHPHPYAEPVVVSKEGISRADILPHGTGGPLFVKHSR